MYAMHLPYHNTDHCYRRFIDCFSTAHAARCLSRRSITSVDPFCSAHITIHDRYQRCNIAHALYRIVIVTLLIQPPRLAVQHVQHILQTHNRTLWLCNYSNEPSFHVRFDHRHHACLA